MTHSVRVEKTRRWADVDIYFDYISEEVTRTNILGEPENVLDIVYVTLPEDTLAANAWADIAARDESDEPLAWTVGVSNNQPVAGDEQSYSRSEYDTAGRVWKTYTQNEAGEEICTSEYVYDAAGRQIQVKTLPDTADETVSETHYDGIRRDYVTDARGNITSFEYDAIGRVITTIHPPTNIDGVDQPAEDEGELDDNLEDDYLCTHVEYDGLGRKTTEYQEMWHFDPENPGVISEFYYDKQKFYRYDTVGRLKMVILPQVKKDPPTDNTLVNPIYRYYYNQSGNQTIILDPLGRATVFEYDRLNRQTKKYMPFEVTFDAPQPDLNE